MSAHDPKAEVNLGHWRRCGGPLRVDGADRDVIQAPKTGASNHALRTHRFRMGRHQAVPAEQAAWRAACERPARPQWHLLGLAAETNRTLSSGGLLILV